MISDVVARIADMATGPPNRLVPSPIAFAVIGSEMIGFTVLGVFIDWAAATAPWATIGLTLAGFAAAFAHLLRITRNRAASRPEAK